MADPEFGQALPTQVQRLWTPANIVTLLRICLVPVFVLALLSPWPLWFGFSLINDGMKSLIAAGLFILISCTDWLDGFLARRRGEVSDFGKFMDPLADKILVAAALLALIELGLLPSWVVLVILAREFIVSGVRMVAASKGVVVAASWYGKAKTVSQMVAIVLFTIKESSMADTVHEVFTNGIWILSWIVMIIALVLTIVSMLDYISRARHLIGFKPKVSKVKKKIRQSAKDSFSLSTTNGTEQESVHKHFDGVGEVFEPIPLKNLSAEVLQRARMQSISLGTAESLTGGMIASALTALAGSSEVFRGAIVSYAEQVKHDLLAVDDATLHDDGVVSEQTARKMAQGACRVLSCDVAVAVTGIAGPGGAESGKPVGTVCIGCTSPKGTFTCTKHFSGTRDEVRQQTLYAALEVLNTTLESLYIQA